MHPPDSSQPYPTLPRPPVMVRSASCALLAATPTIRSSTVPTVLRRSTSTCVDAQQGHWCLRGQAQGEQGPQAAQEQHRHPANAPPVALTTSPTSLVCPSRCDRAWACRSMAAFQSVSYITTVSAPCRLSPTPLAQMDSRNTKAPPAAGGGRSARGGPLPDQIGQQPGPSCGAAAGRRLAPPARLKRTGVVEATHEVAALGGAGAAVEAQGGEATPGQVVLHHVQGAGHGGKQQHLRCFVCQCFSRKW